MLPPTHATVLTRQHTRWRWWVSVAAAVLAVFAQARAANETAAPAAPDAVPSAAAIGRAALEQRSGESERLLLFVGGAALTTTSLVVIGLLLVSRRRSQSRERASADSLLLEQSRSASIIDGALDAIISIDASQHIVLFNPAAERMFGCPARLALGTDISRFIPARLRQAHRTHVESFVTSRDEMRAMRSGRAVQALRADGQEFTVEASISQFTERAADGAHTIMTVMLRDVTARHQAEAELRQLKDRYRTTVELCPNAICITEAGRISLTNQALCDLLGAQTSADLLGRRFHELLDTEGDETARSSGGERLGEAPTIHEVKIRRLDGQTRDVELLHAALPDHGSTTMQVVLRDITARKQIDLLLEQSREQLRRLSRNLIRARERERQHIARELHDELGQHLTAIKLEVAAIAGRPTGRREADVRAAELLRLIDQTVASVRRIAADLRPPMLDDLGLEAAIDWLVKDWSRRVGIAVRLEAQALPETIDENAKTTVYRFVQEALTNVARHARARQVDIRLRMDDDHVIVTVQDDGQGFSADVLAKPGTHGLLGMRERADLAGGTLHLTKAAGGGACVEIRLPLVGPTNNHPAALTEDARS